MQILPPTTPPPERPREQRHEPRAANDYRAFRACLRWDAGFTCCYCLLHESDLMPEGIGTEGAGQTWIEHIEPRSSAPELANEYSNLAYACRFCNNLRSDLPTVAPSGARLLHPWRDAWGDHFRVHEDRLLPRHDDDKGRDARYTMMAYRINEPRRVRLRQLRRALIDDRLEVLRCDPGQLRRIAARQESAEDRRLLYQEARKLGRRRRLAMDELRRRRPIPADAPEHCRCDSTEHHRFPDELATRELSASTEPPID